MAGQQKLPHCGIFFLRDREDPPVGHLYLKAADFLDEGGIDEVAFVATDKERTVAFREGGEAFDGFIDLVGGMEDRMASVGFRIQDGAPVQIEQRLL